MVRWLLAIGGLVAGVTVTLAGVDPDVRWFGAVLALLCCGALAVAELLRRRPQHARPITDRTPDRRVLWTSAPLTLVCTGTAIALAARDLNSRQDLGGLAALAIVIALAEEFLFRGCLLAVSYRVWRPAVAHVLVASSFGFWHAGDSWNRTADQVVGMRATHLVGTVLITFAGGLMFTFIRRRSHSLAGSVFAHIATNLPGRVLP